MSKRIGDHYYRKAKAKGFLARSVFKLEEIDRKYGLVKTGYAVLDLGAAPGSWMQYVSERIGSSGLVVGVDKKPFRVREGEAYANIRTIARDVFEVQPSELREIRKAFDLVLSDMAPSTKGDRHGDHYMSMELCRRAAEIAREVLKLNGNFLCKMFQGEESKLFLDGLKKNFQFVKTQKPQASRSESREVFVLAQGFTPLFHN